MKKRKKTNKAIHVFIAGVTFGYAVFASIGFKPDVANAAAQSWDFGYTGNAQAFTAPVAGRYKLEVWGAQGGVDSGDPGEGGYSSGEINLSAGQTIYAYVGWTYPANSENRVGGPVVFNGGGYSTHQWTLRGSGATDFRTSSDGNWMDYLNTRIIVAGAGGTVEGGGTGGYGGGATGGSGSSGATGGTQTAGGSGYAAGVFGQGGSSSSGYDLGGTGGGGWYGGGSPSFTGGGGGGSSYIGGVLNGQMIQGNQGMPAPGGGTELGHSGAGYARITLLDSNAPSVSHTLNTASWTNQNVTITIVATDAESGISRIQKPDGTWVSSSTVSYTVSGNGVYIFVAEDNAGNQKSYPVTITNIDTTAPAIPTLAATPTAPTNGDVTVAISYPGDATGKEYKIGTAGVWTAYSAAIKLTANNVVYARAIDAAGNVSGEGSLTVSNIDKTAPVAATLAASSTSPTNGNVTVTITYPSDGATKQYKIGSAGTWTSYTAPVVMSANDTIYARSTDAVGNTSTETYLTVSNIDKVAPTTPTLAANITAATNGNVTVTITYSADASIKQYKIGSAGTWTTYTAAVTVTANDTIYARATDAAGNMSVEGTLAVTNIDKTAPIAATLSPSTTAQTNGNVTVTITYPADGATKQYKVGSAGTWTTYTAPVVMSANDTIFARSTDAVGNISVESSLVVANIDKVAPATPTLVASTTAATNGNVTVTITYPSDASVKQYKIGSAGTWTTYSAAVTVSNNDTVYARATDAAGNISAEGTLMVTNIDKTAPVAATFSPSTTAVTNGNVTVTITYPSDAASKEYKVGTAGTWTAYSTAVVMSANDTIYARSTDAVGNMSVESNLVVSNIDKVAPTTPTLVADKTTPTNGNVMVTITYPSDAAIKQYKIGTAGTWTTYSAAVTVSANATVYARATDAAGNISAEGTLMVTNIDNTAPVAATFSPSTTAATNGNVTVTITYPGDAATKEYKVGTAGTWTAYTSPVLMSTNDMIYARSTDAVGNISAESNLVVSNIDKVAPTTPTLAADKTTATNGNVVVTITYPSDAAIKQYKLGAAGSWTTYSAAVTVTANDTVYARATDTAGNISAEGTLAVTNIDKIAPVAATFSPSTTAPTNGNVTVTISYPGDSTTKEYKVGTAGTWTSYTAPVVMSANDTIYARSTDAVGNTSTESNLVVTNIDKVVPTTPTLAADKTTPTNGNVVVTISYPSDAAIKQYKIGSGAWTTYSAAVTVTANDTVYARATDAAGNASSEGMLVISNIDKTAPAVATFSPSTTAPTNGNVTVTITYPADGVTKQYKIGSAGTWASYTAPVVMSANDTIYARSTDAVGNTSAESNLVVANIDKAAPNAPTLVPDKTTATNGNVIVTITYPSDSEKNEYKIGSGAWTTYSADVTMIANDTIYARATDAAGNVSNEGTLVVSNIDKTAPTAATLAASTTTATNGNVTVTITYPVDGVTKQYKIGTSGTWTAYTAPVVMTVNDTIFARSLDAVGNISAESNLVVSNIDKVAPTAPTLEADKNTPTNSNVVVTITYPADSAVKQYKVGTSGTWATYSAALTLTANDTVYARAIDAAGNTSAEGTLVVSNIDKVAPVAATLSASTTSPTNGNVTVAITYPADGATKQYKIGVSGTWTSYTAPVVMSANDTIYARSTDAVGNTSAESNLVVANIDKDVPTAPTLAADMTTPTNGNVNVTISYPSDAVAKQYKIGSAGTWSAYSAAVTVTANDTIYARATDAAGNVSAEGTLVVSNIDKTAPVAATFSPSTTAATNGNVTVTITYPADGTTKQYKIGTSGTWTSYTAPVVMSANDTIYARSTDAVGNTSTESNLVVSNIDKDAPTAPTLVADKTTPTNGNVVVTITYPADSAVKQYKIGSGSWMADSAAVTITANDTIYARATDAAGNVSAEGTLIVSNIDKTAPVAATLAASTTAPTNSNVTVTVTYPSEAAVKEVKVGLTGSWVSYTAPIVLTENNTVYARSRDTVGNVSVESSLDVNNIDKVAPTTPVLSSDHTEATNETVNISIQFSNDAAVKEYRIDAGTWKAYLAPLPVGANTIIYARAFDAAGNVSKEGTLTVENIDKELPSAPSVQVTGNTLTVTPGTDSGSGVKETLVKLGNGNWTAYSGPITLADGEYSIQAKTVDKVGNESTITSKSVTITVQAEAAATAAVVAAETAKTQVSVDAAKPKVNALPNGVIKTDLQNRLTAVQSLIDAETALNAKITAATAALVKAESTISLSDINAAETLITTLPNGQVKTDLLTRLNIVKLAYKAHASSYQVGGEDEEIPTMEDIGEAIDAVNQMPDSPQKEELLNQLEEIRQTVEATNGTVAAESEKTQEAVNAAQTEIDKLPAGQVKDNLQARLDVIQYEIDAANALITHIADATAAVEKAEALKKQAEVGIARDKVNALPNGEVKTSLGARLDVVQVLIDAEVRLQQQIEEATASVVAAETAKTQTAINSAQAKVTLLPEGTDKATLQNRLADVQRILDAETALNQKIAAATAALNKALASLSQADIEAAQALIQELPFGSVKDTLASQLTVVKLAAQAEDMSNPSGSQSLPTPEAIKAAEESIKNMPDSPQKDALLQQLEETKQVVEAVTNTKAAEAAKTQAAVDAAQAEIDKLPAGDVKNNLQDRLDAVQAVLDAQTALNVKIAAATQAVVTAESIKKQTEIDIAKDKINVLPEGSVKSALMARLAVVQQIVDAEKALNQKIEEATAAVVIAEMAKSQEAIDAAMPMVNGLPNGTVKASLQSRLNAVQASLDTLNDQIAAATNAVIKAETTKAQVDVDAAKVKVNALSTGTVKTELLARLNAVQVTIHSNTATDKVNDFEELPTPETLEDAQTAIDKLPDSPEKDALQDKVDAIRNSAEYQVPLVVDKTVKATLNSNLEAVQKAEKYQTKTYIVAALDKLAILPTTITENSLYTSILNDLQTRANVQKDIYNTMVAEQEFATNLAKAQSAISYYEKYKTATYQTKAQDAINLLPDSKPEKTQLQAQLNALVANAAYQDLVTKAETAVTNYEKYRTVTYKTKAQDAINLMLSDTPEHAAKKAEMQARFDAVIPK